MTEPLIATDPELFKRLWSANDVEDKFPQWLTARSILTWWIDNICGWKIAFEPFTNSVCIGFETRNRVELIDIVPPEDQIGVNELYTTVLRGILGDLFFNALLGEPMNDFTKIRILHVCVVAEHKCIAHNGYGVKASMALAFGIAQWKWMNLTVGE